MGCSNKRVRLSPSGKAMEKNYYLPTYARANMGHPALRLLFTNIFVPDLRMFADVALHQRHTFLGVQINDPHTGRA